MEELKESPNIIILNKFKKKDQLGLEFKTGLQVFSKNFHFKYVGNLIFFLTLFHIYCTTLGPFMIGFFSYSKILDNLQIT